MPTMITVHFPPFFKLFRLLFSRWEDDWWCFSENYWSLTSHQLSALPLQHTKPLLSAPGSFAYNARWPLHCGGVRCFAASCSFSFALTVQKVSYHGVTGLRAALMWFWSTFQEATYYSAYECVEFISTHSSACANSFSSVVLPLEPARRVSNTYHWESLVTHGHFHWHISSLSEHHSRFVREPSPKGSEPYPFCTVGFMTDRLGFEARRKNRRVFLFVPKSDRFVPSLNRNHQKRSTWFSARLGENVSVFLIVCSDIPGRFFWFLPSLLISTFGCNYKYCHKTHPSVTCPSKPLMLVCLLNDNHYIFPPFSVPLYQEIK